MVPDEFKYTEDHEWVLRTGDSTVRVGLTDHAQSQLGSVTSVVLPEPGDAVGAGQALGKVESAESVSDFHAPLAGKVVAINESLAEGPGAVNDDCYGEGWLVEIDMSDADKVDDLLDASVYGKLLDQS
ncbi:glycine cleavage system protein GcvH [Streptomyces sp. NPDC019224]|uniref:glycine cleavage system protein GcvH n=1 Tax=Streptomyces sp. NPDC019224 TaxID=3154484 RepID=UPI00340F76BF